jgi:hypothetical protein
MTRQDPAAAESGRDHTRYPDDGLSLAELEAQCGTALPDREAFSTIPSDPSTALLDIMVDLDAALDLAAPINAALAANANVALPIDAAVSANVLSPGSISLADANQTSIIEQVLQGDATASSNQDSAIMQGEEGGTAVTDAGGQTGELESAPIAAAPGEGITPVTDTAAGTEPVAQAAEPVAQAAEPVAQAAEPVAHAAEPVAQAAEPVAHAAEPVTQAAEPVAPAAPIEPAAPAEDVAPASDAAAVAEPIEQVTAVPDEGVAASVPADVSEFARSDPGAISR